MRSRCVVTAALILAGLPAMGATASGTGTLSGRTTDAVTRIPVAGVLVVVAPGPHTAKTDRDGRFAIRGLPSGNYLLETLRAGYQAASPGRWTSPPGTASPSRSSCTRTRSRRESWSSPPSYPRSPARFQRD